MKAGDWLTVNVDPSMRRWEKEVAVGFPEEEQGLEERGSSGPGLLHHDHPYARAVITGVEKG